MCYLINYFDSLIKKQKRAKKGNMVLIRNDALGNVLLENMVLKNLDAKN